MNYLPYATEREATKCLAIFLSEILGIFINWNDSTKLQQVKNLNISGYEAHFRDWRKFD